MPRELISILFQVLIMILKEIQNFIFNRRRVSLAEMELHFHMDGDAILPSR